jgi:hypothetical protein
MTITLHETAEDLNPWATDTDNLGESLREYLKICAKALGSEWPEAVIICNDTPGRHIHCGEWDAEDYYTAQKILEDVYSTGMFWQ